MCEEMDPHSVLYVIRGSTVCSEMEPVSVPAHGVVAWVTSSGPLPPPPPAWYACNTTDNFKFCDTSLSLEERLADLVPRVEVCRRVAGRVATRVVRRLSLARYTERVASSLGHGRRLTRLGCS